MTIFFLSIKFKFNIHVQGLGFTNDIYDYAESETESGARMLAMQYYYHKHGESMNQTNNKIEAITSRKANSQVLESYSGGVIASKTERKFHPKFKPEAAKN